MVFLPVAEDDVPLKRLSDVKLPDGRVPIGAMSDRINVEDLSQELSAKVSDRKGKTEFTINYFAGVKANMSVTFENRRFRIERVIPLGKDEQLTLVCTPMRDST